MRTKRTIGLIVGAIALLVLGVGAGMVWMLGASRALVIGAVVVLLAWAGYRAVIRPWHSTWGASSAETGGALPGDDLVPGDAQTTRAVAIQAPSDDVWPWLVQIGFGRAGWYSYDWIDNDGEPSARSINPAWQGLRVGDRIAMTPDLGFLVHDIEPGRSIVALSDDGSTSWSLVLHPQPGGASRLLSRFRVGAPSSLAALLWMIIAEPGAFVMERRMLQGIRDRAERDTEAVPEIMPVRRQARETLPSPGRR